MFLILEIWQQMKCKDLSLCADELIPKKPWVEITKALFVNFSI